MAEVSATRHKPDLVLADIMMPCLDGFGLLSALRETPELREVPVIFLSARAAEEARVEGMGAGRLSREAIRRPRADDMDWLAHRWR